MQIRKKSGKRVYRIIELCTKPYLHELKKRIKMMISEHLSTEYKNEDSQNTILEVMAHHLELYIDIMMNMNRKIYILP